MVMVSLERKTCAVTGKEYETGSLIMNTSVEFIKSGKESPKYINTGLGLSEEYQAKVDDGFVYLIEANKDADGYRLLGRNAAVRKVVAVDMFGEGVTDFNFCDTECMDELEKLYERVEKPSKEDNGEIINT